MVQKMYQVLISRHSSKITHYYQKNAIMAPNSFLFFVLQWHIEHHERSLLVRPKEVISARVVAKVLESVGRSSKIHRHTHSRYLPSPIGKKVELLEEEPHAVPHRLLRHARWCSCCCCSCC